MFLMLCVVFAAAGPGNPGVGDVFSMGPTKADGAVPHMLSSAAVGGAGFVLGGWCSSELKLPEPIHFRLKTDEDTETSSRFPDRVFSYKHVTT